MIILNVYIVCLVKKKYFASQSIIFILWEVKFPDWLIFEFSVLYAVYSEFKNAVSSPVFNLCIPISIHFEIVLQSCCALLTQYVSYCLRN